MEAKESLAILLTGMETFLTQAFQTISAQETESPLSL
jgi:hypothetical protein